jgi:hypothetical protein
MHISLQFIRSSLFVVDNEIIIREKNKWAGKNHDNIKEPLEKKTLSSKGDRCTTQEKCYNNVRPLLLRGHELYETSVATDECLICSVTHTFFNFVTLLRLLKTICTSRSSKLL